MDESRILTKKVIHAVGVSRMNVAFLVNIMQSIQNIQNVGEAMISDHVLLSPKNSAGFMCYSNIGFHPHSIL